MSRIIHYFTYGTLQTGFPNHERFTADLGPSLGRFRTAVPYPLVVPRDPACPNPGCRFVHRIGALLNSPGEGEPVEGEVFAITPELLAQFDDLEDYRPADEAASTYVRRSVAVTPITAAGAELQAEVYFIKDPAPYRSLLGAGAAEVIARYTRAMALGPLKDCCQQAPHHDGPHDVIAPR